MIRLSVIHKSIADISNIFVIYRIILNVKFDYLMRTTRSEDYHNCFDTLIRILKIYMMRYMARMLYLSAATCLAAFDNT